MVSGFGAFRPVSYSNASFLFNFSNITTDKARQMIMGKNSYRITIMVVAIQNNMFDITNDADSKILETAVSDSRIFFCTNSNTKPPMQKKLSNAKTIGNRYNM